MADFAVGSGVSLMLAPRMLSGLRQAGNHLKDPLGVRLAGGVLILAALYGLWGDTMHRIAQWCGLA